MPGNYLNIELTKPYLGTVLFLIASSVLVFFSSMLPLTRQPAPDDVKQIGYPRPLLQRARWLTLDGIWKFRFDEVCEFFNPDQIQEWTHSIRVPFAPESQMSGIGDTGFHRRCWYSREFTPGIPNHRTDRLIIHFGAVDYTANVWVNNCFVGSHEGGHSSFSFDITENLRSVGPQLVTILAEDDPADLAKPRGKQDWQEPPHSIWYPRTTGIWQSVWLEWIPETHVEHLHWIAHLERWEVTGEFYIAGRLNSDLRLRIRLTSNGQLLADDSYEVIRGWVSRSIAFSDPGIDDFRNQLLWSPEKPTLILAHVQLYYKSSVIDDLKSYTALRSVSVNGDRFMLNGRPYYLRLLLDQGYWPDSLMTAPSEEAFRKDVALVKAMGFNGVRKHQKIEDPRFLFWADWMGLLVWEEMPSSYRFTHDSVKRMVREWVEIVDRDMSHPCVIVWVPFNESWGVPDLAAKAAHQDCVQALYHLTHAIDGTRPVIGNDGWESTATDIIGIHDYEANPENLPIRYCPHVNLADLLSRRRTAGRNLLLEGYPHKGQPFILSEFGGIAFSPPASGKTTWGYSEVGSAEELLARYAALLKVINNLEFFSGFCYTQFTDTFQEANGLVFADRTPKCPIEQIAAATKGLPLPATPSRNKRRKNG